jgi:hypothetical protein
MATKRAKSPAKTRLKTPAKGQTKASRSRAAKKSRAAAKPAGGDALDQFIDAAAHALALPVEPGWKPAVRFNLEVTLYAAGLFADFPLPDDAEPAPVFTA